MKKFASLVVAPLLVLAGCATDLGEPESLGAAAPTAAEIEVTEHQIVVGEPFTIKSPHYVANVTVTDVFRPESCGEVPYSDGLEYDTFVGIEMDVDVESGDGVGFVPNGVNERTEDGYIQKNRSIAAVNCEGYEELSATRVRTGEKHRGVLWLQDDVNPGSEIILEPHVSAQEPVVTEVYVLDLSKFELAGNSSEVTTEPDPQETPAIPTASNGEGVIGFTEAPSQGSSTRMNKSISYCGDVNLHETGTTFFTDGTSGWTQTCASQMMQATPTSHPPYRAPAVEAEKQAGHAWWAECIAANTAEYCRANDPWQN